MSDLDVIDRGDTRIEPTDRAIVLDQPVQKVQTKYTTAIAVQKRRSLRAVEGQAMEEAALLGADAYYAWGNGKDRVEGPSKDLAMALCRAYGNCAVDLGEVQETPDAWIFTATFVDLETGFTLARQFRQSKEWRVFGKFDEARKEDIRFQIGQSKAVRNVILNALPGWMIRRALDKAKGGVREKIEQAIKQFGGEKVVDKALAALDRHGVDEPLVLSVMGRKVKMALTIEDLVILQGNIAALDSGADTVDALFPAAKANELAEGRSSFVGTNGHGPQVDGATPVGEILAQTGPAGGEREPAADETARKATAQRLAQGCSVGLAGCSTDPAAFSPGPDGKPQCCNHAPQQAPALRHPAAKTEAAHETAGAKGRKPKTQDQDALIG